MLSKFCQFTEIVPFIVGILPNAVTLAKKALIGIWLFVLKCFQMDTHLNKNWLLFAQAFFREIAREMEFALSPTLISHPL